MYVLLLTLLKIQPYGVFNKTFIVAFTGFFNKSGIDNLVLNRLV